MHRIVGRTGEGRRRRLLLALPVVVLAALALAIAASSGPVGAAAGFEDDDGDLAPATLTDWNSFSPAAWTGTAPTRVGTATAAGFQFLGLEDWQASGDDSAFAGGTKQDGDCPTVITQKADNKADLKRVYVASKTGSDGHTYLELAWIRIPQNTTSPSAHVGFEFNQNNPASPCGASSDGLVHRQAGDMLVVYDFEGGSSDNPHISLRRWVTSGSCEISSDAPPCWGTAVDLTDLGFAEAKVNTTGSVSDTVAPTAETLGTNEFGEAGIDLTNAGVFPAGQCVTFGKVYGVSRTSGNSGTAQMKDLVGPGNFTLTNCGEIRIIKRTNPRGLNQGFGFTSTIPDPASGSTQPSCAADATPSSFTLNDNGNTNADSAANTEDCVNVAAGTYTVSEGADPVGFAFASLDCTASGSGSSAATSGKTATITLAGGGLVTCVYVNDQQLGALEITKTSSKGTNPGLPGATFSITGPNGYSNTATSGADGTVCVGNLPFGIYSVTETAAPPGYAIDDTSAHSVDVNTNASCSDASGQASTRFTDTPLSTIEVKFTSLGKVGADDATRASIVCQKGATTVPADSENNAADPTLDDHDETYSNLEPDTYTCTVVVDP